MLLRVAARLLRDSSRVGSYVVRQARRPTIRASFQAAAAEQHCSFGMSVRGGRRHHEPNQWYSLTAPAGGSIRRSRRGDWATNERGRDGWNSPSAIILAFHIRTASGQGHFRFSGRGEGDPTGRE